MLTVVLICNFTVSWQSINVPRLLCSQAFSCILFLKLSFHRRLSSQKVSGPNTSFLTHLLSKQTFLFGLLLLCYSIEKIFWLYFAFLSFEKCSPPLHSCGSWGGWRIRTGSKEGFGARYSCPSSKLRKKRVSADFISYWDCSCCCFWLLKCSCLGWSIQPFLDCS